jgi:hypothetical protein
MKRDFVGIFLCIALIVSSVFWCYTLLSSGPIQIEITLENKQ